MNWNQRKKTAAVTARAGIASVALTLGTLTACSLLDKGLEATAPDRVETASLEKPENAALLVNGAVGDFECAFGSYVVVAGLMSGELTETTQTASRWSYDRRDISPSETAYSQGGCESIGLYTPLSIARGTADNILRLLQGWTDKQVPNRTSLIATAAAYAGYSRLLLGEAFCDAAIDVGPKLTSVQLFASAEERFTTAIEAAKTSGNKQILNMAYVGRARARLDQGKKTEAVADAALVEAGFVISATAEDGSSRRQNRVYVQNNVGKVVTVAAPYRGLTVAGSGGPVADTRVPVVDAARKASDNQSPLFNQTKYNSTAASIPIASYKEAQLIIAEVKGGQEAVTIINALRAKAGLPAFSSTDATLIANEVIEARRRELFLEGQHLFDVRRLNLPLVPAPGLPYSVVYLKGGNYGTQRCLPIPDVETLNNPNAGP